VNSVNVFRTRAQGSVIAPVLVLAHGAGAPADSPFMELLVAALSAQGVTTVRFEFPYMEKRRIDGKKRPPDRQPALLGHFRTVIAETCASADGQASVFVGGKSMGGRMASILAAEPGIDDAVRGAVCFGYPFHPPGRNDRWRTDHFQSLRRPIEIIQGTRDPFGRRAEVEPRNLDAMNNVHLAWLEGGDHDYRPLARQSECREDLIQQAAATAARFMAGQE
jgi:predicted alpha/beta-hydrolase family hydrolase